MSKLSDDFNLSPFTIPAITSSLFGQIQIFLYLQKAESPLFSAVKVVQRFLYAVGGRKQTAVRLLKLATHPKASPHREVLNGAKWSRSFQRSYKTRIRWSPVPDPHLYFIALVSRCGPCAWLPSTHNRLDGPPAASVPVPAVGGIRPAQLEDLVRALQESQARQDNLESRMHIYSLEANYRAQSNHTRESLCRKLEVPHYNPQDLPADLNAVASVYSNNPANKTSNAVSVELMEMARAVSGLLDANRVGPKVSHRHLISGVAEFLQSKGDTPSSKSLADLMSRVERHAKLDKTLNGVVPSHSFQAPFVLPPVAHPFPFPGVPPVQFPLQNPRDQREGPSKKASPAGHMPDSCRPKPLVPLLK
jgi:hypothetical protein